MRDLAELLGCHYSTISRGIARHEQPGAWTTPLPGGAGKVGIKAATAFLGNIFSVADSVGGCSKG